MESISLQSSQLPEKSGSKALIEITFALRILRIIVYRFTLFSLNDKNICIEILGRNHQSSGSSSRLHSRA